MRILTINCGSSTLKFELFEAADREHSVARRVVDRIGGSGRIELFFPRLGLVGPKRA